MINKAEKRGAVFVLITVAVLISIFVFSGCKSKEYSYLHDISEISGISIVVRKNDDSPSDELEGYYLLADIEDTEEFMTAFGEIKFSRYVVGEPATISSGEYAVLIKYGNGDYELINHYAQSIKKDGKNYFGKYNCDKQTFNEFVEEWLSV